MYYFLAHFPQIDYKNINTIREKYDPNYSFTDPHITIVFPVDAAIGEQNLISHIEESIKNFKSFPISLQGLEKSWDHYLYLRIQEGKAQIVSLHNILYRGILSPYSLKNIPYIPHITLGFFADKQANLDKSNIDLIVFDDEKFDKALGEAESLDMNFETRVNNLVLVRRKDKTSPAVIVKKFLLGS